MWLCGVKITEMDETRLASVRRDKAGFVYQGFNLLEALTALENVRLVSMERAVNRSKVGDWATD